MKEIGLRLKELRDSVHLSQAKLAEMAGTNQGNIARLENGLTVPHLKMLLWYADNFDVSLDYICCRTSEPQGKLYQYQPKILESSKDMKRFIEMCFDPASPISERLKNTLAQMLEEETKKKD